MEFDGLNTRREHLEPWSQSTYPVRMPDYKQLILYTIADGDIETNFSLNRVSQTREYASWYTLCRKGTSSITLSGRCYVFTFGCIFEVSKDCNGAITAVRPLLLTALKYGANDLDYYRFLMQHITRCPNADTYIAYVHPELNKPHRKSEVRGAAYIYRKFIKPAFKDIETIIVDPDHLIERPQLPRFSSEKARRVVINREAKEALKNFN
jgi:hypothetical protein